MTDDRRYVIGLCRAAGGAVIFALPILMTMEMWWLGFTIDRLRLLLFVLLLLPTLVALSYHAGFEPTFEWREDLADAVIAFGIGFFASFVVLVALALIDLETTLSDALGKIAVQTVPASIGAMLGRTLLGGERADEDDRPQSTYGGELFLMAVGALFLSFSVAPTEEVTNIATRLTPLRTALLVALSLVMMHAFVYAVEFRGQEKRDERTTIAGEFFRLTVPGYAVALLLSVYVLWTFGRTEGLHPLLLAQATVVLGFPASIGAAAARLIL